MSTKLFELHVVAQLRGSRSLEFGNCTGPQRTASVSFFSDGDGTFKILHEVKVESESADTLGVLPWTLKVVPLGFGVPVSGTLREYKGHVRSILRRTFRGTTLRVSLETACSTPAHPNAQV